MNKCINDNDGGFINVGKISCKYYSNEIYSRHDNCIVMNLFGDYYSHKE